MRCPYCNADDDRVVDSRSADDGTTVRRRRCCNVCEQRFTTYERLESEEPIRVAKSDGRVELFDRHKPLRGLARACEKRPVSTEHLQALVNRIYAELQREGLREVPSKRIGEMVMDGLRELDDIAYVRFASVYREFQDVGDFMQTLRGIIGNDDEVTNAATSSSAGERQ